MLTTRTQPSAFRLRAAMPQPGARSAGFESQFRLDTRFVQMLRGYRCSGGLARRDEVLQRLRLRCIGAEQALDAWTDARLLCSLVWREQTWLPLFQFTAADMTPRPALKAIADELAPAFMGWDACRWFAEPNAALGGRRPAELIDHDLATLREAARADRYALLG